MKFEPTIAFALAYIERKAPAKELSGRRTWDFQDPRPAVTFL